MKCKKALYEQDDSGKYALCKQGFSGKLDGEKVKFVKGKYYKISKYKLTTLSKSDQKKYFKYSGGLTRYSVAYKKGDWVEYDAISSLSNTEKREHFAYKNGKIMRFKYMANKYKKGKYIAYSTATALYSASGTSVQKISSSYFVGGMQRFTNAKAVTIVHS